MLIPDIQVHNSYILQNNSECPSVCFDTGVNCIIFKMVLLVIEKVYYTGRIQDLFEKKLCME